MQFENSRLVTMLFSEATALCLLVSFRQINIESTATLIIFNLLFISLIFQLRGTLNRKLGMLASGNIAGLFWNLAFLYLSKEGTSVFGAAFNVAYAISYPFWNFLWIVSFWSLSLAVLNTSRSIKADVKP